MNARMHGDSTCNREVMHSLQFSRRRLLKLLCKNLRPLIIIQRGG